MPKKRKKQRRERQQRVPRPGAMPPAAGCAALVAFAKSWSDEDFVRWLRQSGAARPEDMFASDLLADPEVQAAVRHLRQLWDET